MKKASAALALTVIAGGCATSAPAPSAVPGERQEVTAKHLPLMVKAKTRRGSQQRASRSSSRHLLTHDWTDVAACESGRDWHINTGNGFFGGLQFTEQTWATMGGDQFAVRADLASPTEQVIVAERTLRVQGPGAWPVCSRYLRRLVPQPNSAPASKGEAPAGGIRGAA